MCVPIHYTGGKTVLQMRRFISFPDFPFFAVGPLRRFTELSGPIAL
jgi:hypothetical protein